MNECTSTCKIVRYITNKHFSLKLAKLLMAHHRLKIKVRLDLCSHMNFIRCFELIMFFIRIALELQIDIVKSIIKQLKIEMCNLSSKFILSYSRLYSINQYGSIVQLKNTLVVTVAAKLGRFLYVVIYVYDGNYILKQWFLIRL